MPQIDRRQGVYQQAAIKLPCRVATTANITMDGLLTIDGVTLVADDRVLVKDQISSVDNGIYVADTGEWQRASDFDGSRDVVEGTLITVIAGSTYATTVWRLVASSPVVGTSSIAFALMNAPLSTRIVTPQDYGAAGDGSTDDTNALTNWLADLSSTVEGRLPAGTYKFTSALGKVASNISIRGAGGRAAVLKYAGVSTTADLFTIGDGVTSCIGWTLGGFRVTSDTTMTDGTGIRLRRFCRSNIDDLVVDGQDGTGKLWNGFWFDSVDIVAMRGFHARGQNDCLRVSGAIGSNPKADLYLVQGKIAGGVVGLRCGGAFGGLSLDQVGIINNTTNVVFDTTLVAERNREAFFGSTVAIDGATTGVKISDALASSAGDLIQFVGTWIASASGNNVEIDVGVAHTVRFIGARIYNAGGDGIKIYSTTAVVQIDVCQIRTNGGYGVNLTGTNGNVRVSFATLSGNTSGNYSSNVAATAELNSVGNLTALGRVIGGELGVRGLGGADAARYMSFSGANPIDVYDANDFMTYSRATNEYNWGIAGTNYMRLSATRLLIPAALWSSSPTGGIGYAAGAGGAVVQATDKATGVTLNTACGNITMNNAALAAGASVSFTLTNSAIAGIDFLNIKHGSAGTAGAYTIRAVEGAGSATITVTNTTVGSLSEAIVLKFFVFKTVVS